MDKAVPTKTKGKEYHIHCIIVIHLNGTVPYGSLLHGVMCISDEKPELKDLRSNPPVRMKLPSIPRPSPPPVKEKPGKVSHRWATTHLGCHTPAIPL